MRQLPGIAHGVEPGDEAGVDAHRHDGVDLAVEPQDQRRVAVDLCRLQRRRSGDPAINLALDTNQIRVLTEAISRLKADGQQPVLEAFANSAPWWMTISHCPQGNGTTFTIPGTQIQVPVAQDNLSPSQYVPYAQYLVSVLGHHLLPSRTAKRLEQHRPSPRGDPLTRAHASAPGRDHPSRLAPASKPPAPTSPRCSDQPVRHGIRESPDTRRRRTYRRLLARWRRPALITDCDSVPGPAPRGAPITSLFSWAGTVAG